MPLFTSSNTHYFHPSSHTPTQSADTQVNGFSHKHSHRLLNDVCVGLFDTLLNRSEFTIFQSTYITVTLCMRVCVCMSVVECVCQSVKVLYLHIIFQVSIKLKKLLKQLRSKQSTLLNHQKSKLFFK